MNKIASGIMLILFLAGSLSLAFDIHPVRAQPETIYINPDGSITPSTAPIKQNGSIYTLTGSINNSVVVERDFITIDGNGYTLQGN